MYFPVQVALYFGSLGIFSFSAGGSSASVVIDDRGWFCLGVADRLRTAIPFSISSTQLPLPRRSLARYAHIHLAGCLEPCFRLWRQPHPDPHVPSHLGPASAEECPLPVQSPQCGWDCQNPSRAWFTRIELRGSSGQAAQRSEPASGMPSSRASNVTGGRTPMLHSLPRYPLL